MRPRPAPPGGMRYVHLACTPYLTHMHTGDRSAAAVDAGGVLPGYPGIIVRDGYHAGTAHLTGALHAWCGAHLLRDLKDLYEFEPREAGLGGADGRPAHRGPRRRPRRPRAGGRALDPDVLSSLTSRYRAIAAVGLAANVYRRTATAGDARRIARRFLNHEDMILRFITRPDLDIFTNNEAERTHQAGQGPAAQLRRLLAHPRRARRLRCRPVLPVHRHEMGHHQARRPPRPLQRPPLDAARTRTRANRITAPLTRATASR